MFFLTLTEHLDYQLLESIYNHQLLSKALKIKTKTFKFYVGQGWAPTIPISFILTNSTVYVIYGRSLIRLTTESIQYPSGADYMDV